MENKEKISEVLDSLVSEVGTLVTENDKTTEIPQENISQVLDSIVEDTAPKPKVNEYAYGAAGPIPGETIPEQFDAIKDVPKDGAIDSMVMQAAILKAQKEAAEEKKLSVEEKARKREEAIEYILYKAQEQYFIDHKYIMDGKTKRRTRAKIARDYDKGKYRERPNKKSLND